MWIGPSIEYQRMIDAIVASEILERAGDPEAAKEYLDKAISQAKDISNRPKKTFWGIFFNLRKEIRCE